MSHGVPLHRMAVISYGESAPIADNGTREGRSQNRRIALVVLQ
jgi:outer membrane protein OmpA-like peptidoglycan-associated protein